MLNLINYKIILIVVISFFVLIACQEKKEIDMNKMADLYVDLLVEDQLHTNNLDSLKYYKELVYKKHNTSKSEFENSFRLLKSDQDQWNKFFDLSLARIDTLEAIRKKEQLK